MAASAASPCSFGYLFEDCLAEYLYMNLEKGDMVVATIKKPTCFRLSAEAVECLTQLYNDDPRREFGSMTAVVEKAIIELWDRRLGLGGDETVVPSLL